MRWRPTLPAICKPDLEEARGRQLRLLPDPDYVYQAIIPDMTDLPEEIWR